MKKLFNINSFQVVRPKLNYFIGKIIYRLSIVIAIALCCKCNTSNRMISSYNVIRNNYFSNRYILPLRDTNKVNKNLYEGIFHKVNFENEAKCLLVKIYSEDRVWEDYGLYDYSKGNFYYTSLANRNLFHFERLDTSKYGDMHSRIKTFINQPDLLQILIDRPITNLLDGGNFEVSIIQVNNNQKEILVRSYHW
jgi:hypothetical protein